MKYAIDALLPDFISGEEVIKEFRSQMSLYLGCRYVIPVVNGTVALEVVLRGLGLQRGDFVIVPDISFIATATAVANCGLIPVYADVSSEYFGLTLEALQRRFTPRVKAVILVHFSGFVNREIAEISEYCRNHKIALVEDCAQAFSCSAYGAKTGALADAGTFSFQSSKIINSGEGGLISTHNELLAAEYQAISDWGLSPAHNRRKLDLASSNFRLSALQCYFLTKQIQAIDEIVDARFERLAELKEACEKLGVESCLPRAKADFHDCPFFFPVRSSRKLNTIEPREESPMHRSSIVKSILKQFYPDLLEIYRKANPPHIFKDFESNRIISEIDFINIHQALNTPVEHIILNYKESISCPT
ncbi:MAG: DegT/DnrJ/EryC1/StrS family aminotransferase [Spirochaetales bacterium]|nr:DegT/DnrJ/EryC1/StrS family aminotransferase [Spirochaetales bacterium]